MLTRPHQGELHLILNILDVQRAASGHPPHEGDDHLFGEALGDFADTRRCGTLVALHRQESLGHGHLDLAGLKTNDCAIAPNDLDIHHATLYRQTGRMLTRGFKCALHLDGPRGQ